MRRGFVVTFALGLIVALFGLIWALQGFGVLGGSPMSNTTTWSIIGPITVLIGIVIAVVSWRKLSSKWCCNSASGLRHGEVHRVPAGGTVWDATNAVCSL